MVDSALGIATALAVLLGATMLARITARAFAGASLSSLWLEFALLVVRVRSARSVRVGDGGLGPARRVGRALGASPGPRWSGACGPSRPRLDGAGAAKITAVSVQGVEALEGYFARYLPQVVLASIVPFLVIAWVAFLDLEAAVIMLLTLPLVPVFMWLIGTYTEEATRARWLALRRLSTHFLDVVRGLPTLRAFGRARAEAAVIADVSDRYREATMATLRISFLSGSVLELAATIGVALVAVTAGVRLVAGQSRAGGRAGGDRARAGAVPAVSPVGRRVPRQCRRAGGGRPAVRAARCAGDRRRGWHAAGAQPGPGQGGARAGLVLVSGPPRPGARGVRSRTSPRARPWR